MKKLLALLVVSLIAGCSLAPDYHRPTVAFTDQWQGSVAHSDALPKDWWTTYNSTELGDLIVQAQKNNTDLKAGVQRVEQARAQVTIARSFLFPAIGADADASYNKQEHNSGPHTSYGAGVNISYEADLWGLNANDTNAAKSLLKASQYDQAALELTVAGDIAQAYFQALTFKQEKIILSDTVKTFEDTLKIVQAKFDEGAASGLDLAQQKVTLANAQASLASIDQQITVAQDALAILIGQAPQDRKNNLTASFDSIVIPAISPLQPSALLERRPDIRSLEEGLKAANADIGAARAAIFPSLTISGSTSGLATPISDTPVLTSGLTASIVANIFNAGRLRAQVTQATARQKELAESYRGAVLVAFQETEDALAEVKAARIRQDKYDTALREARNANQIANAQYTNGASDFLALLDTQRSLLQAEQNQIQAKLDSLTATVDLYRTLGGGWEASQY